MSTRMTSPSAGYSPSVGTTSRVVPPIGHTRVREARHAVTWGPALTLSLCKNHCPRIAPRATRGGSR